MTFSLRILTFFSQLRDSLQMMTPGTLTLKYVNGTLYLAILRKTERCKLAIVQKKSELWDKKLQLPLLFLFGGRNNLPYTRWGQKRNFVVNIFGPEMSCLPESTMMSSSSPDPSSSLNTTCFPWRTIILLPEKPPTFKTTASSSGFKGFLTSSDFGLELLEPFQQGRPTSGSSLHFAVAGELKAGFELVPVCIGWLPSMLSVGTGMLR